MWRKLELLFKTLEDKKPSITTDKLLVSVEMDLNMSCKNGLYFCEPKIKNVPLTSGDNPVSLEEYAIPPNNWLCGVCRNITSDKALMCDSCGTFRLVESLPNVLDNPTKVTKKEIEFLEKRRELEKYIICARDLLTTDVVDMESYWYLVSTEWLNQWKSFVFNKAGKNSRISSNTLIGVLPPGPIANYCLLLKDKKTIKENLKIVLR